MKIIKTITVVSILLFAFLASAKDVKTLSEAGFSDKEIVEHLIKEEEKESKQNSLELLQARLDNTEKALMGIWTLMETTMPEGVEKKAINDMLARYYQANSSLGSKFTHDNSFINSKTFSK